MNRIVVTLTGGLALAAFAAGALPAAAADPYHMRGMLTDRSDMELTIDEGDGVGTTVMLNKEAGIFAVEQARLSDIQQGQFVGITSIEKDGVRIAIEVHIFEEALRGLAEGHYPWDLVDEPNMMTNANVAQLVETGDGRKLTVSYVEGSGDARTEGTQTILVPPDATIVNFFAVGPEKLVPGGDVFLLAIDNEDGTTTSPAIVVGQNGVTPPM